MNICSAREGAIQGIYRAQLLLEIHALQTALTGAPDALAVASEWCTKGAPALNDFFNVEDGTGNGHQ